MSQLIPLTVLVTLLSVTNNTFSENLIIVRAELKHNPVAIAQVINQAYVKASHLRKDATRTSASEITDILQDANRELYLCLDQTTNPAQICGTALLNDINTSKPELSLFAVAPNYQGKQVGKLLLQHTEARVSAIGQSEYLYLHIIIPHQDKLITYYEKQGFVFTGEIGFLSKEVLAEKIAPEYWSEIYFRVMRKKLVL